MNNPQDKLNKEDYDKNVMDVEELEGTDIKINPDYYVHMSIRFIQKAFSESSTLQEGFIKYKIGVNELETICQAANLLDEEYYQELDEFRKSEEYTQEEDKQVKSHSLQSKKFALILKRVFSHKVITDPLYA